MYPTPTPAPAPPKPKSTQNNPNDTYLYGEKEIVTPINTRKELLCAAYGKINQQNHVNKALQISDAEKHDLFMNHPRSFSAPDACYNLLGGSVCK